MGTGGSLTTGSLTTAPILCVGNCRSSSLFWFLHFPCKLCLFFSQTTLTRGVGKAAHARKHVVHTTAFAVSPSRCRRPRSSNPQCQWRWHALERSLVGHLPPVPESTGGYSLYLGNDIVQPMGVNNNSSNNNNKPYMSICQKVLFTESYGF